MLERDLFTLQAIANQGKYKFVNITQKGNYAVAEATNGFCYLRIAEKNIKQFNEGFFKFTGRFVRDEVELPKGYEILSSEYKNIGEFQYKEPFDIKIGEKGEFFCSFYRKELINWLKQHLSTWNTADSHKFRLVFHRGYDVWRLRGYTATKVLQKEIAVYPDDNITDTTFTFTINPHTFRQILKWFECDVVKLWFHNGNYECKSAIFMEDNNKLAVLMPIARVK